MADSPKNLVHPELRPILAAIPQRHYTDESLVEMRRQSQAMADTLPAPGNDRVRVDRVRFPGLNGAPDVEALVFTPIGAARPLPAMLQIHGGGYINGLPELYAPGNTALADQLQCIIVAPRYRRAPETPYPGPHDDCYAALAYLFDQAETLGVDRMRIGVTGDSAGGGLAASLCLRARDEGQYAVAFQHLIYPMIDDRVLPGTDQNPHVGEHMWTLPNNRFGWGALIGGEPGGVDVPAYCAPARADNLEGLPPTFIATGALDLFLEEDMEYARRLARAGVELELHVYPGAFHAFDHVAAQSSPARAITRDRIDWYRRQMAPMIDGE